MVSIQTTSITIIILDIIIVTVIDNLSIRTQSFFFHISHTQRERERERERERGERERERTKNKSCPLGYLATKKVYFFALDQSNPLSRPG